ncbi:MAG TPA: vWA domain-containing protein [Xanthobacteraceae bacterium]|jgi:Flp pilus assembly protein TadG
MIISQLQQLACERRGNVILTFALSLVPIAFLTGLAMDFTAAEQKKEQLDAAADAAALAAVTPAMMAQPDANASTAAQNIFNARANAITGINYDPSNLSVTVSDNGLNRTVTVSYTAASQNSFAGILNKSTWSINGSSQSSSSVLPNIDFYLLLDNSPSMAIGATTADINTLVNNTPDKCGFGCHESDTSPNDYYGLAKRLGVTLRIDKLRQATQNLMTTAQQSMQANNNQYRVAIYTFNTGFNTIASLTSTLSTAQTQAGNIDIYEVPYQNWNNDAITNYDTAMSNINSIMPNPGGGTNSKGDKPQEVLFFVTDGVEDEMVSGKRQQSLMDPAWCTTIKNRGIRIAVLYTVYLPLPTNSWYNTYIAPFQPQIGPTLQSCASPGLYFAVQTDQDISAAMQALFQKAVATARLTK